VANNSEVSLKENPIDNALQENRAPRHFVPTPLCTGLTTELPPGIAHHIGRVTRMKSGDHITLFNGDGFFYHGTLDFQGKNTCTVSITHMSESGTESELSITLLQGLSSSEKMAWTIEKTTELGVNRIIPMQCSRSVAQLSADKVDKKQAHWLNIARAAAAQSGRAKVPTFDAPLSSHDSQQFLKLRAEHDALVILSPGGTLRISAWARSTNAKKIALYIGPEGGLTEVEINFAIEHGFQALRIGPRVLRTETAGPTVIASLQALLGDF
jgi:16S rRNA (uracil1498-N3)-methyltransferase